MRLLKLSETLYGAGFSVMHPTYLAGFPQREACLFSALTGWQIHWYRHQVLTDDDVVRAEGAKLDAYLRELDPDFIVYDNPTSSVLIPHASRARSVFDVCDWYLDYYACEHGTDAGWFRLRNAYLHALSSADFFLFQSTTISEHVLDRRRVSPRNYLVVPNGYDDRYFNDRTVGDPDHFRSTHQLPDLRFAVFAGKLGRWYSPIIDVADCMPAGWMLLVVGDGPLRPLLKEHPKVRCLGMLDLPSVADTVRNADVCVLPVDDCSPIATSEYLACGKPVVHLGDRIRWMITDGENGFVVPNARNNWGRKILEAYEHRREVRDAALATPRPWHALCGDVSAAFSAWSLQ